MPKSHKRKNKGIGIDFKRAKQKVGKVLPRAENQTNTEVKSKAIHLSEQSIVVNKEGQAVTHRKLTLKDLLGQASHYSEKTRLDAIEGLIELIRKHPEEARKHAGLVVAAAAQRIEDPHAACRTEVRNFFNDALLPALGKSTLQPFVPVIMGHICSALTNLDDAIRVDALLTLSVVMDWRADIVAAGFMTQVLQHFLDALGRPIRGRSLKAGSIKTLANIVDGLYCFLSKIPFEMKINESRGDQNGGSSSDLLAADTVAKRNPAVLMWNRCRWANQSEEPILAKLQSSSFVLSHSQSVSTSFSSNERKNAGPKKIFEGLLTILFDCWAECSPSEFSSSPDYSGVLCATRILQCATIILEFIGLDLVGEFDSKGSLASKIIKKVDVVFPVCTPVVAISTPVKDQLIQLNIASARLMSMFLPRILSSSQLFQTDLAKVYDTEHEFEWVFRLLCWLTNVITDDEALSEDRDSYGFSSALDDDTNVMVLDESNFKPNTKLPISVYLAALNTVKAVLPMVPPYWRRELIHAIWILWKRSPVKGALRFHILELIIGLFDKKAAFLQRDLLFFGNSLLLEDELTAWITEMPRFLWELGDSSIKTTRIALQLLLNASIRSKCSHESTKQTFDGIPIPECESHLCISLKECQVKMAPLFLLAALNQSKDKKSRKIEKSMTKKIVLGPFSRMPIDIQNLAADVLYHMPTLPDSTLKMVSMVACARRQEDVHKVFDTSLVSRLLDMVGMKASEAEPISFWSFLLSVMTCRLSGIEIVVQSRSKMKSKVKNKESHAISNSLDSKIADTDHGQTTNPTEILTKLDCTVSEHWNIAEAASRAALDASSASEALDVLGNGILGILDSENLQSKNDKCCVLLGILVLANLSLTQDANAIYNSNCDQILQKIPQYLIEFAHIYLEERGRSDSFHSTNIWGINNLAARLVAAQPLLLASLMKTITKFCKDCKYIAACVMILHDILDANDEKVQSTLLNIRNDASAAGQAVQIALNHMDQKDVKSLGCVPAAVLTILAQRLGINEGF